MCLAYVSLHQSQSGLDKYLLLCTKHCNFLQNTSVGHSALVLPDSTNCIAVTWNMKQQQVKMLGETVLIQQTKVQKGNLKCLTMYLLFFACGSRWKIILTQESFTTLENRVNKTFIGCSNCDTAFLTKSSPSTLISTLDILGEPHYIWQFHKVTCTHLWKAREFNFSTSDDIVMSINECIQLHQN